MSASFIARPERELRFSPNWDGECLVFDRPTTDLFVVPEIGRAILEALHESGPMDSRELGARLGLADAESAAAIDRLLLEFEACGLVEPLCVDCCGPDSI